jgi:adenylate cyclase
VYSEVEGKLDAGFEDRGEQQLKNISKPVHAYALSAGAHSPPIEKLGAALPLPDKPSIAVLPFENMSDDPEQEYFADGMVEEIITALSRKKQLFVIARNSSFTFKGKAVDIKQVAQDLGVRYVLKGSVRKSGNRIRITGQLIDAASGVHLWADRFDGALADVFDLQDQVAASVVGAITPSVTRAEIERAMRKPTDSLDAYDCFLRGMAAHWQVTRDGTDQAISLYEQAISLDPQFVPAHAALAVAINQRRNFGWSNDPASDLSQSVACAKSALRLGPQDPSILARVATVFLWSDEVELADSLSEEAIRLDPNEMVAWMWGGWSKVFLGNHQTAVDYFHRALRLSPLDPRAFYAQGGLGFAYFFVGNYEQGRKYAVEALRYHPEALLAAMACSALGGDAKAAREYFRQLAVFSPNERVPDLRRRSFYRREQDFAKLEEAFRIAGMPE